MGDLSEHLSKSEFACRDCGKAVVSPELIAALEELRKLAGRAIRIISGYRCPERNAAVGGAGKSQHLNGYGADIAIEGLSVAEMYALALEVDAFREGGLGVYHDGHLHVDVRGAAARWGYRDHKYMTIATFFGPKDQTPSSGVS